MLDKRSDRTDTGRFQSSVGVLIQLLKDVGRGGRLKLFSKALSCLVVDFALESLSATLLSQEDSLGWCTTCTTHASLAHS